MIDYLALFLNALLAATILPLSSEVVLGVMSASGDYDQVGLWLAAGLGNVLGALINWVLGREVLRWQDRRWFPISAEKLAKASAWFQRWGKWSLLLAWVPVIGDPLTFAAGVMRENIFVFLVLVALGKFARYAVVIWSVSLF